MKKCYSTLFLVFFVNFIYSQAGEWTWMNGDSSQTPIPYFGTQGVFGSLNTPPALYEACEWTDLQGNFWLFGGANNYSDLWKFDPTINQWAWIKGPGIMNQSGIYGTQGVPSPTNNPGARSWGCATWADTSGNLWLFGGLAYDVNGNYNEINDLWKYNISTNEWTWMKGSNTIQTSGVYGTKGISSPANTPPCMWENNGAWTDSNNNLWLFGGISYSLLNGSINTLWKYNIATNEWTWVNGTNTGDPPPVYGIKGVSASTNNPGGRTVYSKWKDSNDNLWFFGGGYTSHLKNDLWKYNIATDEWTWISGDSATIGNVALNGSACIPSIENIPKGRYENRACWTRKCDNLALYGGYGATGSHSDLWNYNISDNEWTLVTGDTTVNLLPIYGTKLVSNPNNRPGASGGAIGWKENNGNLWLFGGNGGGNTMWRFAPDTTCPHLCDVTGIPETLSKKELTIQPNPFSSQTTLKTYKVLKNASLTVYNSFGQTVTQIDNLPGQTIIFHRDNLPSGLYFIRITQGNKTISTDKLVIADE